MNIVRSVWRHSALLMTVDPDFADVLVAHDDDVYVFELTPNEGWCPDAEDTLVSDAFLAAQRYSVEMTIWRNPASGEPIEAFLDAEPVV